MARSHRAPAPTVRTVMLELVRVNNEKLARQLAHVLGREGIRTRT